MKKNICSILAAALLAVPVFGTAAPLKGRLSLGYVNTSGNTEEEKINFDYKLSEQKSEKFKLLYDGLVNYGKSSGQVNADKKQAGFVGEFIQNSMNSWYIQTGLLKDRFAGYKDRYNLGAGLYKTLIADEKTNLKASAGFEYTKEEYTDSTAKNRNWLKLGLKGDKIVGDNIKLFSFIDYGAPKANFNQRYEIDFGIGSVFAVNSQFDFETRYLVNYKKTPLVAGKNDTDSALYSSLVYKL